MRSTFTSMASAAIGSLVLLCMAAGASGQITGPAAQQPVTRVASLAAGAIQGTVQDEKGAPLVGAMVSALGATSAFAVTDRGGRFELRTLSPGPYLVSARLSGFVASRGQIIEVRPSARASSSIALRHVAPAADAPYAVVPAGMNLPLPPAPSSAQPEGETASAGGDDHGELAWRLRHARRGILKDATLPDGVAEESPSPNTSIFGPMSMVGRVAESSAHSVSNFFTAVPLSGQLNLLTAGSLDTHFFTTDSFSRGIAYVAVGAPVGDSADWSARGAVTQGDIPSWIVAGSYATRAPARHRYEVGLSYAAQRYDLGNPVALVGVTDGGRSAGVMYGYDTFAVSPALTVTYGARYARYDYLTDNGLLSPRLGVTIAPVGEHFRINGLVSRRTLAPGEEEFLPPGDNGIWLPPERTFSSFDPNGLLQAERTNHLEAGFERDLSAGSTMVFRVFRQHVADQLATVFGVPGRPTGDLPHYLVGNTGDVDATGWSAGFRTTIADRVHGSVEYTQTAADWNATVDSPYAVMINSSAVRPGFERIHDVSTAIETDVPETSTRVMVLYRISNAFAHPAGLTTTAVDRPMFDARFDVQVRQALPFMNFSTARWEALFAIRDFFRDAAVDQSVYDELLVVRPPTRVVGGLTLKF